MSYLSSLLAEVTLAQVTYLATDGRRCMSKFTISSYVDGFFRKLVQSTTSTGTTDLRALFLVPGFDNESTDRMPSVDSTP